MPQAALRQCARDRIAPTPNKWHTMAVISGKTPSRWHLFGCIPYNSSGANIGEGAWDMRILDRRRDICRMRMAVAVLIMAWLDICLQRTLPFLPSLEGRNTIWQRDQRKFAGRKQLGQYSGGKDYGRKGFQQFRNRPEGWLHERDSVYRIPSFSTLFGDTDGFSFYESIGDIAGGTAVPWERGHCLSIRREMRWSGCRRKKRTQAAWSGTIKTVLRYDF